MTAPPRIETERLVLRRPLPTDAEAVYRAYASDPEVTRFLGWPRHRRIEDTRAFIEFSDTLWRRTPAGPYLIESRADGALIGGTGLEFTAAARAVTGYVLSRPAWGLGYATEALRAMVDLARALGVHEVVAVCHIDHHASQRVLEKCGFACHGQIAVEFPNLSAGTGGNALRYEWQI